MAGRFLFHRRSLLRTPFHLRLIRLPDGLPLRNGLDFPTFQGFIFEERFSQPPDEGPQVIQAWHLRLIGRYWLLKQEFEPAEAALGRSLELFERSGSRVELGRAYAWRAILHAQAGNQRGAAADLQQARQILSNLQVVPDMAWLDEIAAQMR